MKYTKPEIYSDADWEMVQGYMRGKDCLPPQRKNVAYMHGYMNGQSDASGIPRERAEVLRRRANMIPGITPMAKIIGGQP
ncbi:hypothetical protein ACCM60_14215 [Pseudomonas chlororaphis subsp. aureofaciens]|uniref:hypothetical protein n=1 Tax=Pseudomonas chlororaphis TaxID=587753 RepID=UPI00355843E7